MIMKFKRYIEQSRQEVADTVNLLNRFGFHNVRDHLSDDRFVFQNGNGDRITLNGTGSGTDNFTHAPRAGKIYYGLTRDLPRYIQSIPKHQPVNDDDDDDNYGLFR